MPSVYCIAALAYMGRYGNFGNKIGNLCSLGINAGEGKLYKMQITGSGNGSHSESDTNVLLIHLSFWAEWLSFSVNQCKSMWHHWKCVKTKIAHTSILFRNQRPPTFKFHLKTTIARQPIKCCHSSTGMILTRINIVSRMKLTMLGLLLSAQVGASSILALLTDHLLATTLTPTVQHGEV